MRARDTDRNLVVEALQTAYVDGQIDTEERERRVDLALTATYVDDLRGLVQDLQNAPYLSTPPPAPMPGARRRLILGAAGSVVLVGGLIVGINVLTDDEPTSTTTKRFSNTTEINSTSTLESARRQTVMWSQVHDDLRSGPTPEGTTRKLPGVGTWSVTQEKFEALLAALQSEFGTPYLTTLEIWPDSVRILRPINGTQPRVETWNYYSDSGLTFGDVEDTSSRDLEMLDLRDLDVDAFFRNLEQTSTNPGLEAGSFSWATVAITDGAPLLKIHASNRFSDVAWTVTTLDGVVIEEHLATS